MLSAFLLGFTCTDEAQAGPRRRDPYGDADGGVGQPKDGLSQHDAWQQPILRLADTAIGVAVGIAAAWTGLRFISASKSQ